VDNKNESLVSETNVMKKLEQTVVELDHSIATKQAQYEAACREIEEATKAFTQASQEVEQQLLYSQRAAAGVAQTNERGQTLTEQLLGIAMVCMVQLMFSTEAKKAATTASVNAKQAEMKAQHLKQLIAEKSQSSKASKKDFETINNDLSATQVEIKSIEVFFLAIISHFTVQAEIASLNYDQQKEKQLRAAKTAKLSNITELREKIDVLSAKLSHVNFTYTDPVRGFDRAQVKGLVANLIQLSSPKFATGVEVAAAGKLFNVVVETEEIGKQLLSKGQLKKRVTIIPLNRIKSEPLSKKVYDLRLAFSYTTRKYLLPEKLLVQTMYGLHFSL